MKKIMLYLILLIGIFSFPFVKVKADKIINDSENVYTDCNSLFSTGEGSNESALDIIRELLDYIRILGPILLILFVAIDFGQAVLSQDNDALKKAQNKVVFRAIATVALFLVPTIISAILGLDGIKDVLKPPSDPLCGTMNIKIIKILKR